MNHFRMKLGLNGGDQALALQVVKQGGGDAIQISDGLCLKTPLSQEGLAAALSEKDIHASLTPVDSAAADLSPDERSFLA